MQIVIDMPKEVYESAKNGTLDEMQSMYICGSVVNGTPLPKGHGRLIDKDALGEKLNKYSEAPYQYAIRVFNESPIIIGADN